MTITSVELYRYRLPLTAPLRFRDQEIHFREGFILRVRTADGAMGLGEIAPLPGYSTETLDEARASAASWCRRLLHAPVPLKPVGLIGGPAAWAAVPSSVQFALSTVAAMLKATRTGDDTDRVFPRIQRQFVSLNALIHSHGADAAAEAREAVAEGYRSIKLKVGRRTTEEDIDTVRQVRAAVADDVSLRLDANRAWDFQTAECVAAALRAMNIEYVEEPVDYWKLLFPYRLYTHVNYAIDETLHEFREDLVPEDDGDLGPAQRGRLGAEPRQHLRQAAKRATAHIIKPTLFGGMRQIQHFVDACSRPWSALPVISSSFESGLGLILLANLAAALDKRDIPIGLDTYKHLAADVLTEPLPLASGQIDLAAANRLLHTIDFSALELIALE